VSRGWIVNALLDLNATDSEIQTAARGGTEPGSGACSRVVSAEPILRRRSWAPTGLERAGQACLTLTTHEGDPRLMTEGEY
jgi:hypothetical protein